MVDETYELFGHTACHYSDIQRASDTAPRRPRQLRRRHQNVVDFVEQLHFADSPARYLGGTTGAFDELSIAVYNDGTADSDLYLRLDAPTRLYSRAELHFIGAELIDHVRALVAADDRPVGALDVLGGAERPRAERTARHGHHGGADARRTVRPPGGTRPGRRRPRVPATRPSRTANWTSARTASPRRCAGAHVGPETVVARGAAPVGGPGRRPAGRGEGGRSPPADRPWALPAPLIAARIGDGATPARALLTDTTTAGTLLTASRCRSCCSTPSRRTTTTHRGPRPPRPDHLLAVLPDDPQHPVALRELPSPRQPGAPRHGPALAGRGPGHRRCGTHAPPTPSPSTCGHPAERRPRGRRPARRPRRGRADQARAADDITAVWLPAGLFTTIAAQRPDHLAGLHTVWTGGDRVPRRRTAPRTGGLPLA
ncbi:hypothetical protein [Streptomyces sp. KL116D]|uniref:hypothetical protein n=1 Tax=Streptomyces sp. KL116D TaxID=3045152 RepID=UPI003558A5B5